jgi:signal transduction histidine kinase
MAARAINEMQTRIKRYVDDRTAMVGAISHDLRTPLARIRFKLEAKTPDRAAILSDVEKMEAMIASVLAFIRDAAAVDRREDLDLLSVVEVVVDDAALTGGDVQLVDSVPLTVTGDAVALQRLLSNLVDNALKYGGAARVRIREQDRQAIVEIEDDGPGLSSAELARVFEPFYRADASRNLDEGGVGLGLAVARSLARAHGGDVELISRPGGLTARVSLPLA